MLLLDLECLYNLPLNSKYCYRNITRQKVPTNKTAAATFLSHFSPRVGWRNCSLLAKPVVGQQSGSEVKFIQPSLVLWCRGYHICFTRRRSPVRSWAGSDFFVTAISRTKLQVSELILDCGYYLPIVIYSAQLCLPCHITITNTIDVSARHYPAVLSHTHMVRASYIVPILTGTGSPV